MKEMYASVDAAIREEDPVILIGIVFMWFATVFNTGLSVMLSWDAMVDWYGALYTVLFG